MKHRFGRFKKLNERERRSLKTIALHSRFLLLTFVLCLAPGHECQAQGDTLRPVPDEIRFEACLPNQNDIGHPLPLAAHWNTGQVKDGFAPKYQMEMIKQGHFLLPWFQLRDPNDKPLDNDYYEGPMKWAAQVGLPISFLGTQWERLLTTSPEFSKLPLDKNPNVIDLNGKVLPSVCPFGPVELWREAGREWTSTPIIKKLQEIYPNPPLVLFVSNNEHGKLQWEDAEGSLRYLARYGKGKDDSFKRKVIGDGWIERYRALQEGMRERLIAKSWKDKALFMGYDAFGGPAFARWGGWIKYSLYTPGRFEPWPLAWDGASVSFYVHNWNASTDFTVWSPQVESMNWVFMQKEAQRMNPGFWFEISTWDGHEQAKDNDKRKYYAKLGQAYNPERYAGMVQFGMWLLRPRVVREFRDSIETVAQEGHYFLAIVDAVDAVHNNAVLRRFWRRGQLVANTAHPHPYQADVPEEYQNAERWFLLDSNLDPVRPWNLGTQLPVYSLALALGNSPEREWLVYAYSPLAQRSNASLSLPGYGPISVDAGPAGVFYEVMEKNHSINRVSLSHSPPNMSVSDPEK
jgi:hypothetical protein